MKTAHRPYRPKFTSVATDELLDSCPAMASPMQVKVPWCIKVLGRLDEKLLEASCHLGMLHTMLQNDLASTIYATDSGGFSIGNILGHARQILLDAQWGAGYVHDNLANNEASLLHGFDLNERLEHLRSTAAMVEAFANNMPEGEDDRLAHSDAVRVCVAVHGIMLTVDDIRQEAQSAAQHLSGIAAGFEVAPPVPLAAVGSLPRANAKPRKSVDPTAEVMA